MYKCAGPDRVPVYQDAPCPPGAELRDFAADPATVSVVPLRQVPGSATRVTAPPARAAAAPLPRKAKPDPPEVAHDPAERRHLPAGIGEGEVLARLGAPNLTSGGKGRRHARWTYMPVPGDPQTVTTVLFEYGKVVEVERKVVR